MPRKDPHGRPGNTSQAHWAPYRPERPQTRASAHLADDTHHLVPVSHNQAAPSHNQGAPHMPTQHDSYNTRTAPVPHISAATADNQHSSHLPGHQYSEHLRPAAGTITHPEQIPMQRSPYPYPQYTQAIRKQHQSPQMPIHQDQQRNHQAMQYASLGLGLDWTVPVGPGLHQTFGQIDEGRTSGPSGPAPHLSYPLAHIKPSYSGYVGAYTGGDAGGALLPTFGLPITAHHPTMHDWDTTDLYGANHWATATPAILDSRFAAAYADFSQPCANEPDTQSARHAKKHTLSAKWVARDMQAFPSTYQVNRNSKRPLAKNRNLEFVARAYAEAADFEGLEDLLFRHKYEPGHFHCRQKGCMHHHDSHQATNCKTKLTLDALEIHCEKAHPPPSFYLYRCPFPGKDCEEHRFLRRSTLLLHCDKHHAKEA